MDVSAGRNYANPFCHELEQEENGDQSERERERERERDVSTRVSPRVDQRRPRYRVSPNELWIRRIIRSRTATAVTPESIGGSREAEFGWRISFMFAT